MKKILLTIIVSIAVISAVNAQEITQLGNVLNREKISLNGD